MESWALGTTEPGMWWIGGGYAELFEPERCWLGQRLNKSKAAGLVLQYLVSEEFIEHFHQPCLLSASPRNRWDSTAPALTISPYHGDCRICTPDLAVVRSLVLNPPRASSLLISSC